MQIVGKTIVGKTITLEVAPSYTFHHVKIKTLKDATHIHPSIKRILSKRPSVSSAKRRGSLTFSSAPISCLIKRAYKKASFILGQLFLLPLAMYFWSGVSG